MDTKLRHKIKKLGSKLKEIQDTLNELEEDIKEGKYEEESDTETEHDNKLRRSDSESDYNSDSDDEDDFDDDDGFDDEYFNSLDSNEIPMSENLMECLNMDEKSKAKHKVNSYDNNQTQWVPPGMPGLNNSNKII